MTTSRIKKLNEDGVSPVIGVILMVAITVILAAIIAMFVFGMTDSVGGAKVVGMTVTEGSAIGSNSSIDILWQGGRDIATLDKIAGTINGENMIEYTDKTTFAVGKITSIDTAIEDSISGKRVVLVGYFTDGHTQILIDKVM